MRFLCGMKSTICGAAIGGRRKQDQTTGWTQIRSKKLLEISSSYELQAADRFDIISTDRAVGVILGSPVHSGLC